MTDALLPSLLLCAGLGLALAAASWRTLGLGLAVLAASALVATLAAPDEASGDTIGFVCWIGSVLMAATAYRERGPGVALAMALAANAGVWSGFAVAVAGRRGDLAVVLPWALLCLPGRWLVQTKRRILVKIVASWLIAISLLSAALPIVSMRRSVPDHME